MNKDELKGRLSAVFKTLEKIQVSEYTNVCNMSGAMQVLYDTIVALDKDDAKEQE